MKKFLQVAALISILIACSDFYPEKIVEREGVRNKNVLPLPEKATLDLSACKYGQTDVTDSRTTFLWNLATKSVCPKVVELRYHATLLRQSARDLCAAKTSHRAERDITNNWYNTMSTFQFLVANPMEPLRANMNRISNEMYAWPVDNKFAVNAELIKASEQGEGYEMQLAASRKGLSTIERLIFNKAALLGPGLSGRLRPEEEAFNNLPPASRLRARCLVISQMVDDVAIQAETLFQEWDINQKQYPRQMLQRLAGGAQPMILNEVSDGLFYLEKVKDFKLGRPLGQNVRCRKDLCPDDVEHALSGAGIESLRANFEAFRAGMLGEQGPGFLTLVREVGRGELADNMQSLVEGMAASLAAVEDLGDLRAQVAAVDKAQCLNVDSPLPICRLFFQWKAFSTLYRTDFMTALNLNPPRTEADND